MEPIHLRIKRSPETDDGIIFAYLAKQRQPQNDLACEAMRAYWLPLALKNRGIKKKELESVARKSIVQLLQQAEYIRMECGLGVDEMPCGYLSVAPRNITAVPINSAQPVSTENVGNTDDEVDIEEEDGDDPYGEDAF